METIKVRKVFFTILNKKLLLHPKDILPDTEQEALYWSVKKWGFLSRTSLLAEEGYGSKTCGLCLFHGYKHPNIYLCEECILTKETGIGGCVNTPFQDYDLACRMDNPERRRKAAKEFYELLHSIYKKYYGKPV